MFSCTDKELRQKEYGNLMDHYYKTLTTTIKRLGRDPEKSFTRNDFEAQLKKFGKFAFICAPVFLLFRFADPKDIPNMDDFCENLSNNDEVDFFTKYDDQTQQVYVEKINGLLTELVDLGFYWK